MEKKSIPLKLSEKKIYFIAGLLLSCLVMIPYLLLGTGSIVTYHDQLDGELFSYILTARYLFTDIRIYPEIMNGLPATGAVPPAPLFVLFYVFFEPFTAFMLTQWCVYMVGFLGMYFLLLKLTRHNFISFSVAVIFMLMPFYPVYGLCIPGQPLLLYAVLTLCEKGNAIIKPQNRLTASGCVLLIIFYALASSLVLSGFACLLVLLFAAVFFSLYDLKTDKSRRKALPVWLSFFVLALTYLETNLSLIKQVLFPQIGYISHKTEMVLSPYDMADSFLEALTKGVSYAQSFHTVLFVLLPLSVFLLIPEFQDRKSSLSKSGFLSALTPESKGFLAGACKALLFILIVSVFYMLYHGETITAVRNASDGVLKTFNLDRVTWLLPVAWCIFAAYLLSFIFSPSPAVSGIFLIFRRFLAFSVLGVWGITVLYHSSLKPNLSKLLKGGEYYALDWDCFFASDIYEQIDNAIGRPQNEYHVLSVGIYPAAAAYNGFYCLDGYSNNYPLEYKHTFRRIMAGELEKNSYVRDFFDNWGNRCYITTAEQANYYTFEKKWGSVIYDLDLDTKMLKELDCQYIFSAAYIMNAEETGLSLLQDAPFETEKSWYHIYVYTVR